MGSLEEKILNKVKKKSSIRVFSFAMINIK